jgi:hypothetical protein
MTEWFDELSRGLAAGQSRRTTLRLLGGVATGLTVWSAFPGLASADQQPNQQVCKDFCNNVFPTQGGLRGACRDAAEKGTGPCFACGPAAPAGHPDVCSAGTKNAICCPASAPRCINGQCVALAGTGPNRVTCFCADRTTVLNICAAIDCNSGIAQDSVCGPACAAHGGEFATACFPNDPACAA